jgi:TolB-like protein
MAASMVTGLAILATLAFALRFSEVDATARGEGRAGVLAVMPFQPLSPDPDTSYLGIGLADSIINNLSGVPGLTVRPMSAALSVAKEDAEPLEAARRLQATEVLTGTYQQVGSRFQVSVQLVDADTGFALWGRTFNSGIDDLIELEQKVVRETLATLVPDVKEADTARRALARESDATARYLYMLARGKLATWESRPIPEAVELLEQAIRIDPDFAAAHASLAEASASMFYGGITSDATWIDRAIASGRRAVYLDPRNANAHYALGYADWVDGNPTEAAREMLRALELDPGHALALESLAGLLSRAEMAGPARLLADRAREADPSLEIGWVDLRIAVMEGTSQEMIARLERLLDRRRGSGRSPELPIMFLGYMAFRTGDAAAGLRWAAMLEEASANKVYADMIRMLALARTGDAEAVMRIVEKNRVAFKRDSEYCQWIGIALAKIGENSDALDWLERSVRLGNSDPEMLAGSPDLDPLRTNPRFQKVLSATRGRAREIVQLAAFAGYR